MTFPICFLRHLYFQGAVLATFAASAAARPGDMDVLFNPAGVGSGMPGMVVRSTASEIDHIDGIGLLPDGRIVGAGIDLGMALTRWPPDGSQDVAFGQAGIVRHALTPSESPGEMALQADGRIIVTINGDPPGLLRFLPDGTLDRSFGDNGRFTPGPAHLAVDPVSVVVLSDGKILAGGSLALGDSRPHLWRMLPDGSYDPTFGIGGRVTLPQIGYLSQIIVQPNGRILATGMGETAADAWVVRLEADGALDTTFAGSGRLDAVFPGSGGSDFKLALQSDGKILLAGSFVAHTQGFAFFVNRYHPYGTPDTSFNGIGRVTNHLGKGSDFVTAVAVKEDGKVLVAGISRREESVPGGTQGGDPVFVRYLPNGTLDPGFGISGVATFPVSAGFANLTGMVIQPDGKILAGGNVVNSQGARTHILLLRIMDPSLTESLAGEWPAGAAFPNGGTVEWLPLLPRDPATPEATLILRNTSSGTLTNLSAAMGGPDAANFSLQSPLPSVLRRGETLPLTVRFLPGPENASFTGTLRIRTGNPKIAEFQIVLRGKRQQPVATLALLDGTIEVPDDTEVDFGPSLPDHPVTKTFTMRNTGSIELILQGISLGAAGSPGDFKVKPPEKDTLAPGESTTFEVTFGPRGQSPGPRTAGLRIVSTDTFNFPYEIKLTGSLAIKMDAWRLTHFGTAVNDGPAADFSDPDGDGIVNLVECATLTDPLRAGPPAAEVVMNGNLIEYTFTRSTGAPAFLTYDLEWTSSLQRKWIPSGAPPSVLSDNGTQQRIAFSFFPGNDSRGFVRLRVTRR